MTDRSWITRFHGFTLGGTIDAGTIVLVMRAANSLKAEASAGIAGRPTVVIVMSPRKFPSLVTHTMRNIPGPSCSTEVLTDVVAGSEPTESVIGIAVLSFSWG